MSMRIIGLEAENIKRIEAISIEPSGNLVQITGKNGAGKSSVLDSIWFALAGGKAIQKMPIRKGANEARIKVTLGGDRTLVVTRTFTRDPENADEFTTKISVASAEGARFSTPQNMLDALCGELTFDPLEFQRMKPEAQLKVLQRFVTGFDFEEAATASRQDFQERTAVNRRAKELQAQSEGIEVPHDTPDEPVDEQAILNAMEEAAERNTERESRIARRQAVASDIARNDEQCQRSIDQAKKLRADAAKLLEEAAALERVAAGKRVEIDEAQRKLDAAEPLPAPIDLSSFRVQLAAAKATNGHVAKREERARLANDAGIMLKKSAALTAAMDGRDAARRKAIEAAEMPIAGLDLTPDGVTLDGVPFEQASDAQQLRASIAIAAALNPKLRIARVRDGSLLDDDGIAALGEFAAEKDFQIWLERVSSDASIGIHIEAGRVKGAETDA